MNFWTPALAEVSYEIGSVRVCVTQDLRIGSLVFSDFLHEVRGSKSKKSDGAGRFGKNLVFPNGHPC